MYSKMRSLSYTHTQRMKSKLSPFFYSTDAMKELFKMFWGGEKYLLLPPFLTNISANFLSKCDVLGNVEVLKYCEVKYVLRTENKITVTTSTEELRVRVSNNSILQTNAVSSYIEWSYTYPLLCTRDWKTLIR